ncbi:MAG: P-II family nitrogen regulator [Bacteroidales bacterium]|nr:P-II family nitrogen regulator [Bacteroidales bacterium]
MKEIKAFVRPIKVNGIIENLQKEGFENISISMAEGTGKFQAENAFVSKRFSITNSEIAKLEIVVSDEDIDTVVSIISENGKTIYPGDGIIYVSCVENMYRVKDGLIND